MSSKQNSTNEHSKLYVQNVQIVNIVECFYDTLFVIHFDETEIKQKKNNLFQSHLGWECFAEGAK